MQLPLPPEPNLIVWSSPIIELQLTWMHCGSRCWLVVLALALDVAALLLLWMEFENLLVPRNF